MKVKLQEQAKTVMLPSNLTIKQFVLILASVATHYNKLPNNQLNSSQSMRIVFHLATESY